MTQERDPLLPYSISDGLQFSVYHIYIYIYIYIYIHVLYTERNSKITFPNVSYGGKIILRNI